MKRLILIFIFLMFITNSFAFDETTDYYTTVIFSDVNISSTASIGNSVSIRATIKDENALAIPFKQAMIFVEDSNGNIIKDYSEQRKDDMVYRIYSDGLGQIYYKFVVDLTDYKLDQNYTVNVVVDSNSTSSDFLVKVKDSSVVISELGNALRIIEPYTAYIFYGIVILLSALLGTLLIRGLTNRGY